jgi:hypothetical protein
MDTRHNCDQARRPHDLLTQTPIQLSVARRKKDTCVSCAWVSVQANGVAWHLAEPAAKVVVQYLALRRLPDQLVEGQSEVRHRSSCTPIIIQKKWRTLSRNGAWINVVVSHYNGARATGRLLRRQHLPAKRMNTLSGLNERPIS